MNYFEKTFWDMQKSCISFLNANSGVWKTNPIIKEEADALFKNEKDLAETVKTQGDSLTEGHVAQKRQEIIKLGKSIYRLSCSLSHLAKKTNNKVLQSVVDISESGFTIGEEKEIMARFGSLLDTARTRLADLTQYQVTAASLDQLEARYKKLQTMPETISVVEGIRKGATRSIKELNTDARIILDRLDDALEAIIADEKFLEGWFDARKIKGRHRGNKKNDEANGDAPPVK